MTCRYILEIKVFTDMSFLLAIFPFVVLIILFGYGLSKWNDGAKEGIVYYLKPDLDKLLEVKVWYTAAIQIFYSLGVSSGGLVTLASYNKFDSNCYRDSLLVSFINCGTSVFAGFAIFAILGFMGFQTGKPIREVVQSGPALAFIAYPKAVSEMGHPGSQIMSFLFFTMLLTLGLDSMFTLLETVITAILDNFKQLIPYKSTVVIVLCSICFILGLSMCAEGGFFMFELFADYSSSWNVLLFAVIELLIVSWSYGANKFLDDITKMGIKYPRFIRLYWQICWKFITPLVLFVVIVLSFVQSTPKSSNVYNKYIWPDSIQALCWLMPLSTVIFIPVVGIYQICRRISKGKPITGSALIRPTHNWKPSPDSARVIDGENKNTRISKRASRQSFRRHLPSQYQPFISDS